MQGYEKLVRALRERARREDEYYEHGGDVINDAAAAIEALEEDNADLNETVSSLIGMLKSFGEEPIQVGKAGNKYTLNEPKRGEWVGVSPMVDTVQCSVCGGQLFSEELETPYCPYCGAKMEVQE